MDRTEKQIIDDAFRSDETSVEEALQVLIDTEIIIEILEQRKFHIIELLQKKMEEKNEDRS